MPLAILLVCMSSQLAVCSQTSRYVAKNLWIRSIRWNVATQERLTLTTAMIGSIKNIKMLGMQETVASRILDLREKELEAARSANWLTVVYSASGKYAGYVYLSRYTFANVSKRTPSGCLPRCLRLLHSLCSPCPGASL